MRRDVVYLVSPMSPVEGSSDQDPFNVAEIRRPDSSKFIENVLVSKVAESHQKFSCIKNVKASNTLNPEIAKLQKNVTAKVVRAYIDQYYDVKKCSNDDTPSNKEDENHIYHNSPLRKKPENVIELEKYRKARKKSGKECNYIENDDDANNKNENDPLPASDNWRETLLIGTFIVAFGCANIISFFYGRSLSKN